MSPHPPSLRVRGMRNWTGTEQLFLFQGFIWAVWLPKLHLAYSQHYPALVRSFIHFEPPECTRWNMAPRLNLCSYLQNNTFWHYRFQIDLFYLLWAIWTYFKLNNRCFLKDLDLQFSFNLFNLANPLVLISYTFFWSTSMLLRLHIFCLNTWLQGNQSCWEEKHFPVDIFHHHWTSIWTVFALVLCLFLTYLFLFYNHAPFPCILNIVHWENIQWILLWTLLNLKNRYD